MCSKESEALCAMTAHQRVEGPYYDEFMNNNCSRFNQWQRSECQEEVNPWHGTSLQGLCRRTHTVMTSHLVHNCTIFLCSLDVGNRWPMPRSQYTGERSSSWVTIQFNSIHLLYLIIFLVLPRWNLNDQAKSWQITVIGIFWVVKNAENCFKTQFSEIEL